MHCVKAESLRIAFLSLFSPRSLALAIRARSPSVSLSSHPYLVFSRSLSLSLFFHLLSSLILVSFLRPSPLPSSLCDTSISRSFLLSRPPNLTGTTTPLFHAIALPLPPLCCTPPLCRARFETVGLFRSRLGTSHLSCSSLSLFPAFNRPLGCGSCAIGVLSGCDSPPLIPRSPHG